MDWSGARRGATMFGIMKDFPAFMKHPANKISASSQATPGVEGYVFDGADGSQMHFGPATKPRRLQRMSTTTTNT
jgi:hypothetical protein